MASEMKEENNSASSDVKNEESIDETKKIDREEKDGDKDSIKSEIKDESSKEASEDEDEEEEEESDDEEALLDRPVEVTGCRARKKVERLEVSFATPKEKHEFPEGKGKKLGDCPRIEAHIQKMKPVDLKPMHKILFNRTGSANEIKKNIRKFSGFPFEKDSPEFARKKISVEKLTASVLKQVCLILDIERGGTKEDIVTRIMSFLLSPEDSGKKVAAPKKKVSKEKKKSIGKKTKSEKKVKSSKDESDLDDDDDDDDDDDEGEAEDSIEENDDSTGGDSMGGTDEEAEALLTEPKKKSKKSKPKAEKGKKNEKKQKGTKRKQDDNEKSSGDSDDEPATKKSKMPSDEEISKLVKQILESADLQEITMKKVIKQVSDTYPNFDLSHKKAFIKSTIKSIL